MRHLEGCQGPFSLALETPSLTLQGYICLPLLPLKVSDLLTLLCLMELLSFLLP